MTTKNSDTLQNNGATRLREFMRQDREDGTHPAIEALRARPQMRAEENRKFVEYARIDRGQMS
ncbi:hypothetical protein [uncultured Paracoccus sp.]|uniref:hypothetical protein n=1 Tax=uncultured Paracoccus sp. TaxID=189685 RepID=UPI0025F07674|nr:hypothetical protein [uncultured Paracoccus sp.]